MIKIGNCLISKNEILYIDYENEHVCDIDAKLCIHLKNGEKLFLRSRIEDVEFLESKGNK